MNYNFNLSIWQTENCVRCGGCCYACFVNDKKFFKPNLMKCDELVINPDANNTSCILHGQPGMPLVCKEYFCGKRENYITQTEVHGRLVAVKTVLDIFKIRPVDNAEEIRKTLEQIAIQEKPK